MKRLYPLVLVLLLMLLPVAIGAEGEEKEVGEVLYHQDFGDLADLSDSTIRLGTASAPSAALSCPGEYLEIRTYDGGRAYVLLPAMEMVEDASYTLEFSFCFENTRRNDGYLSVMLTCRGEEPTNITTLIIRADGTVDDFSVPDEKVGDAIRRGEVVDVKIPLPSGVLHEMTLTAPNGSSCTVKRDNVQVISYENVGFLVRNTDVRINEIFVVNGTGYENKTGPYAEDSTEQTAGDHPSGGNQSGENAPQTGDGTVLWILVTALSLIGLVAVSLPEKRTRTQQ